MTSFVLINPWNEILAKQKGDFKLADQIRNELLDKGVIIEDQRGKTTWKLKWAKKNYIFLTQR